MAHPYQPALEFPGPIDPAARRIEIDEFISDDPLCNLFLLALRDMQDEKPKPINDRTEDWFSYYNLGGIHGFPLEQWRGVRHTPPNDPQSSFYCTHGSLVFPTWHRLSIMMIEQAICRRMKRKAMEFSEHEGRQHYVKAVERFRLPYWDPVMPRNERKTSEPLSKMFGVPHILVLEDVHVMKPGAGSAPIQNPLHHFSFPSKDQVDKSRRTAINWQDMKAPGQARTVRSPDQNGNTDDDLMIAELQGQYSTISNTMFQLLNPGPENQTDNHARSWGQFANHTLGQGLPQVSLESWHDNIHGLVGSGNGNAGHMAYLEYASFDPIFWLHHNNVERLFALYQSLYEHEPDKFVSAQAVDGISAASQLAPFIAEEANGKQRCYSSNDVRDWTKMGFAVPGVKKLDDKGRQSVANYLKETYFWSGEESRPPNSLTYPKKDLLKLFVFTGKNFQFDKKKPCEFVGISHSRVVKQVFPLNGEGSSEVPLDTTFKDETGNRDLYPPGSFIDRERGHMRTWNVLLNVKKYAFNESFDIQFFIGLNRVPPVSEGYQYLTYPANAGFTSVFAYRPEADCDNCSDNAHLRYGDVVPLTTSLTKYLRGTTADPSAWPPAELRVLESLEAEHVVPFLTRELEWRIVDQRGGVKGAEEVTRAELEVLIADRTYDYPKDGEDVGPLGRFGEYSLHPEVTRGKVGGVRE